MGATEEQMELLSGAGITHVAYVLVLYSFAFLIFLFVNILLHLYSTNATPSLPPKDTERVSRINGQAPVDSRHIRDAEEFELEGLMSDDEEAAGLSSPSTLGKNNQTRAE